LPGSKPFIGHAMQWRDTIILMGIPIDNVTTDDAVEKIVRMAGQYRCDGRPRHVATVNVDFMVNTLSWNPLGIRHPELLHILRQADLVTADGMPLVWLSKILGTPLPERVAGADLVPKLAKASAERGLSLYFLGGRGDVAAQAAEVLIAKYPGVRIAGIDAPFVHTQGAELADFESRDQPVLEKINEVDPDILLIGFGNPKQEIWFDRNRGRIRAGVSIGIGGTFEFITGRVSRAPVWMQQSGLEWLYRMMQEPRRLLKRYFIGLFKFGLLALPSILYIFYTRVRVRKHHAVSAVQAQPAAAGSPSAVTYVPVMLPDAVDTAFVSTRGAAERERILLPALIVMDFSGVVFIDSSGLGFLFDILRRADAAGKKIYFTGMTSAARHVFQVTKTWDMVAPRVTDDASQLSPAASVQESFFWSIAMEESCAVVLLYGTLDAFQASSICLDGIMQAVGPRHILLNLEGLSFCDSSGIALFLKMHRMQAGQGRGFVLYSAGRTVQQMLRMTKLDRLIACAGSLESARRLVLHNNSQTAMVQ
jgi:N-acetylglucosaminyldiphosphoundecaprenol N-acetyl-beta-D-mannosaminyltransferase